MKKFGFFALILLAVCGCQLFSDTDPSDPTCPDGGACCPDCKKPPVYKMVSDGEDLISLQNLNSRVIVHCRTTAEALAEVCAQAYEAQGFVRLREIPYKTADYDFSQHGAPSRRWRPEERTPRW